MKERKQPDDGRATKPQEQTGEEFGSIRGPQRKGNNEPERSDTPRGSETETRAVSGRRG
ncbi:MAG: hypothetical protein J0I69_01220 [Altererythrobacter sp.]|nr:hypothetical protein [Altererythrobacter sp.]